jgi:hypothetical protein
MLGNRCAMLRNWCAMHTNQFIDSNMIAEYVTHNNVAEIIMAQL